MIFRIVTPIGEVNTFNLFIHIQKLQLGKYILNVNALLRNMRQYHLTLQAGKVQSYNRIQNKLLQTLNNKKVCFFCFQLTIVSAFDTVKCP